MRTTIALALLGLTAVPARQRAATEELRLTRSVIETRFGGTRGYVRATPSGRLVIDNEWGRRIGSVRPLRSGGRTIVVCGQGRGCLQLAD
jgi:hypothetical protein